MKNSITKSVNKILNNVKNNNELYVPNEVFESFQEIKYNIEWENGTGYLDHACEDKSIAEGSYYFTTYGGRDGIILKSSLGTVVIFQRWNNRDIIVNNSTKDYPCTDGSMTDFQIAMLISFNHSINNQ